MSTMWDSAAAHGFWFKLIYSSKF